MSGIERADEIRTVHSGTCRWIAFALERAEIDLVAASVDDLRRALSDQLDEASKVLSKWDSRDLDLIAKEKA